MNKRFKKIYLQIQKKTNKLFAGIRRKKLLITDFSIISNNCWGGKVYQYFDLPYTSPTVGMYFFADEYIRFLKNYRYYLSLPLKVISASESKYLETLKKRNQSNVLIGILDDVEIVLLHYHTASEAITKWKRRVKRLNYKHLLVKFSRMDGCTDHHMQEFDNLNFDVKIAFDNKKHLLSENIIYISGYDNQYDIKDDTTFFHKYTNLVKLLNRTK